MKNKKIVVTGLLLLSVTLAACSTAASTELAVNFPNGKFVKAIDQNHGVIFNSDGTFAVFDGSMTIANGTYRVEGDTYIETSNDQACPVPMSFRYTFDGTNLIFNYVGNPTDDPCGGRQTDFNDVTYLISK
ncbi:MAG TPA: hypothetical protein VFD54_09305 [Anaerolineales bacterium]|jgi:hypothetical protein|nr:hypothetical protein [Anaerolineales bacterium]